MRESAPITRRWADSQPPRRQGWLAGARMPPISSCQVMPQGEVGRCWSGFRSRPMKRQRFGARQSCLPPRLPWLAAMCCSDFTTEHLRSPWYRSRSPRQPKLPHGSSSTGRRLDDTCCIARRNVRTKAHRLGLAARGLGGLGHHHSIRNRGDDPRPHRGPLTRTRAAWFDWTPRENPSHAPSSSTIVPQ